MVPEIKYAKSKDVHVAYQTVGSGPIDLVLVPGWVSNIEIFWEEPALVRFLERLSTFSRVILFDKRGTGLSDRVCYTPILEERMDDLRAVMDEVRSAQAALVGYSEGGPMCSLFAATYPERTRSLITIGSYARRIKTADYPWGVSRGDFDTFLKQIESGWGGPVGIERRAPSLASDPVFRQWWARFLRLAASPATAIALTRMNSEIDVRKILPSIRVPTLIIHAERDGVTNVEEGRYLSESIPGARLKIIPAVDHLPWVGRPDMILDAIEEFLTGSVAASYSNRVLYTVMFTDIAASTERAARVGDRRWHYILKAHDRAVRHQASMYGGREIDNAGDGFFFTFDGPARAIRCALAVMEAVGTMQLSVRIGIHIGECEQIGEKLAGIAVHIGARIAARAEPGQVWVSQTVKDLVAGSGIRFRDRGTHRLKGVPDKWHLYEVAG
jgi:pimeloyl-ACP methyl ester carboxylesterase